MQITAYLAIPDDEIAFEYSRSGGPGGQNVNKLNTKVTLRFNLAESPSLSEFQKELIREKLANRLTGEGALLITSSEHRTQMANREAAVARFCSLLATALRRPKVRRATRPTRGSQERRLTAKHNRSGTKRGRRGEDLGSSSE